MEVLKKRGKEMSSDRKNRKCFINDCCFLCWLNFLLFDLMLIFKFFISATPLILPNIYQNIFSFSLLNVVMLTISS